MRDPVYNYIYYNEELEEEIIDTVYIQRLRQLYQLPTARFVYPGANHSRFLHSIGVMELAGRMATELLKDIDMQKEGRAVLIESARIVGLLHDCGHGPFSHTFDGAVISEEKSLIKKGIRSHEDISSLIIEKSKIKDILQPWGIDKIVKDLFSAKEELPLREKSVSRIFRRWVFTADVLDFLVRDAYFCGVKEYGVDVERITRWIRPYKGAIACEKRLLPSIFNYLLTRFYMFDNVYFHRTSRAIDCLTSEIFQKAATTLEIVDRVERCSSGDFKGFLELTDYSIFDMILHYDKQKDKRLEEAQNLVKAVLTREIPIRELDAFSPVYGSTEAAILDNLERKYTKRGKLLLREMHQEVRNAFQSKLRKKGYKDHTPVYVDYTDFRYLSDYPLTFTGELPIYDRRTGKTEMQPVINEFLKQHAVSPKKIRVYTSKNFEKKHGGKIRKRKILVETLGELVETREPVY
jgi:HD superfamily phosphohydrolase